MNNELTTQSQLDQLNCTVDAIENEVTGLKSREEICAMTGWTKNEWDYRKKQHPNVFVPVSTRPPEGGRGQPAQLYDWNVVQAALKLKMIGSFNQVAALKEDERLLVVRNVVDNMDANNAFIASMQMMQLAIQKHQQETTAYLKKAQDLSIENAELMKQLSYGNHQDYWTVRRVYETVNDPTGQEYDTHRLKEYSTQHGYSVITTKIGDHCRNGANAYHKDVWKAVYPELGWGD